MQSSKSHYTGSMLGSMLGPALSEVLFYFHNNSMCEVLFYFYFNESNSFIEISFTCYKIHLIKVYNSVVFSISTK